MREVQDVAAIQQKQASIMGDTPTVRRNVAELT
jgi:hypothetical protein